MRHGVTLVLWISAAVIAQLLMPTLSAQEVGGGQPFKMKGVSPEATRVLPAQTQDGRGQLLPLHSASVLEWLCKDPNVIGQLKTDRSGCYRAMWPGVKACEAQLHDRLPRGRSVARATGKPDIVAFRTELRSCLEASYVQRQQATGSPTVQFSTDAPDPLAPAMGGG